MADMKHVGKLTKSGRKVLVAFRTLPGASDSALVIDTTSLPDELHNPLIQLVESPGAQSSFEFHEVLARSKFPDGSTMLPALHQRGKLIKVRTDQVEMTPNFTSTIRLSDLNQLIAEKRGISVNDLAIQNPNQTASKNPDVQVDEVATVKDISPGLKTTSQSVNEEAQPLQAAETEVLSDAQIAAQMRSQAETMLAEATRLKAEAETLAPTKKATVKKAPAKKAPARKAPAKG